MKEAHLGALVLLLEQSLKILLKIEDASIAIALRVSIIIWYSCECYSVIMLLCHVTECEMLYKYRILTDKGTFLASDC